MRNREKRETEIERERAKKCKTVNSPVADVRPGQVKTQCLVHGLECIGSQLYGHFNWTLE